MSYLDVVVRSVIVTEVSVDFVVWGFMADLTWPIILAFLKTTLYNLYTSISTVFKDTFVQRTCLMKTLLLQFIA